MIDTLTNTVTRTLAIQSPRAVAFNSTGSLAYTTSGTAPGHVQVVDTATYRIIKTVQVGAEPVDISMTPEDGWLVVDNYSDGTLTLIDPVTYATQTIRLNHGDNPRGFVLVQ